MKKMVLLICVALVQCNAKSHEDMAKELIEERLKTTLPNFTSYESISYGTMGSALLSFEEREEYLQKKKAIRTFKDSAGVLQQKINTKTTSYPVNVISDYKVKMQQFLDSAQAKENIIDSEKRVYVPQKLFKISHSYKAKDKAGIVNINHTEFYFDKDFKGVVKESKIDN